MAQQGSPGSEAAPPGSDAAPPGSDAAPPGSDAAPPGSDAAPGPQFPQFKRTYIIQTSSAQSIDTTGRRQLSWYTSGLVYFEFPAEVRKIIMEFIFCPGHIFLRAKPTKATRFVSYSSHPDKALYSPPGIQFKATCQQAYGESLYLHPQYFSENVFHLPPGPLDTTINVFNKWNLEQLALIKKVSFRVSSLDLTPALIKEVESNALRRMVEKERLGVGPYNSGSEDHKNREELRKMLCKIWNEKAMFMTSELPGIHTIQVSSGGSVSATSGMEPNVEWANGERKEEPQTIPLNFLRRPRVRQHWIDDCRATNYELVYRRVSRTAKRMGWERYKKVFYFESLYMDFVDEIEHPHNWCADRRRLRRKRLWKRSEEDT